jgi:hypothetical protein
MSDMPGTAPADLSLRIAQDMMADTISCISIPFIRRICAKHDLMPGKIRFDLTSLHGKKRTDNIALYRFHSAQAMKTAAPE